MEHRGLKMNIFRSIIGIGFLKVNMWHLMINRLNSFIRILHTRLNNWWRNLHVDMRTLILVLYLGMYFNSRRHRILVRLVLSNFIGININHLRREMMRHPPRTNGSIPINLRQMHWLIRNKRSIISNLRSKFLWHPPRIENIMSTRPRERAWILGYWLNNHFSFSWSPSSSYSIVFLGAKEFQKCIHLPLELVQALLVGDILLLDFCHDLLMIGSCKIPLVKNHRLFWTVEEGWYENFVFSEWNAWMYECMQKIYLNFPENHGIVNCI